MSSVSSPARGLAIYGGSTFLVYLETQGFRTPSPFLGSVPYGVLALLTLSTNMYRHVKYPTAASYVLLGVYSNLVALRLSLDIRMF